MVVGPPAEACLWFFEQFKTKTQGGRVAYTFLTALPRGFCCLGQTGLVRWYENRVGGWATKNLGKPLGVDRKTKTISLFFVETLLRLELMIASFVAR